MNRRWLVVVTVALLPFLIYEFAMVQVCDDWSPVTVQIAPTFDEGVKSVWYLRVGRPSQAEAVVESMAGPDDMDHAEALPFEVQICRSFRSSPLLGREWGHVQESDLIVLLEREDGSKEVHRSSLPSWDHLQPVVISEKSRVRILP